MTRHTVARHVRPLAALSALWAAVSLVSAGLPAMLVVSASQAIGIVMMTRWALPGALVVMIGLLGGLALEVPASNGAGGVSLAVLAYLLGRQHATWMLLPPTALFVLLLSLSDLAPRDTVSALAFLLAPWFLGRILRRSATTADAATARATHLESQDVKARAELIVAGDRARIDAEAVEVVHEAVAEMRRLALTAGSPPEEVTLVTIQARGRAAVEELRTLLMRLRSSSGEAELEAVPVTQRRPWQVDLLTAAAVTTLGLVERLPFAIGLGPTAFPTPTGAAPFLLFAALALRRTSPTLTCLAGAAAFGLALLLDEPVPFGLAEALAAGLVTWTVTTRDAKRDWWLLGLMAATAIAAAHSLPPLHVSLIAAVFTVWGLVAHTWLVHSSERTAAELRTSTYRTRLATAVRDAITAERRAVARALHDVASHAVGVMVLQAAAADALREEQPAEAVDALGRVAAAGTDALTDLLALREVLQSGQAARTEDSLAASLEQLTDRMELIGITVRFRVRDQPPSPAVAATAYRVVTEAVSNAAKYAPGAVVTVSLEDAPTGYLVQVTDDGGTGEDSAWAGGTGLGLVGLAERVTRLGGLWDAHHEHPHGFTLRARFPRSDLTAGEARLAEDAP